MKDYYGETIWQFVKYRRYFNWHSTRLDAHPWQTRNHSKLRQNIKYSKKYLKRSRQRIQQSGTHSCSAKREVKKVSNNAVSVSLQRMWVTYWLRILWMRATISRCNEPNSTFRKPEGKVTCIWYQTQFFQSQKLKKNTQEQLILF